MKVRVLQEDLLKGLNIASRFVASRAQLPVLSNILLSSDNNGIKLAATNLETGIVIKVGAKVDEIGAITIPAKTICELISHLTPGQVNLDSQEENLQISTNFAKVQLSGVLATEFPQIPEALEKTDFTISSQVLNSIKNQVVFAATDDTTRPVLTGVSLTFSEDKLKAVATDGFRLSYKEFPVTTTSESKLLIPARLIDELARIVGESQEPIQVNLLEKTKQVLFSVQNLVLTGRLLEGEFPPYERIVPNSYSFRCFVDRESFSRAIKLAGVIARESSNIVKLKFVENGLIVASENKQYGSEEMKLDAKTEGGELEIVFNYKFLSEFLNCVSGTEVIIESEGPMAAAVFKDSKDPSFYHLIMPVRIQE